MFDRLVQALADHDAWEQFCALINSLRDEALDTAVENPESARDCALRAQGIEKVRDEMWALRKE